MIHTQTVRFRLLKNLLCTVTVCEWCTQCLVVSSTVVKGGLIKLCFHIYFMTKAMFFLKAHTHRFFHASFLLLPSVFLPYVFLPYVFLPSVFLPSVSGLPSRLPEIPLSFSLTSLSLFPDALPLLLFSLNFLISIWPSDDLSWIRWDNLSWISALNCVCDSEGSQWKSWRILLQFFLW